MKRFTGEVFYSTIKGKLTARAEFYDEKQERRRQVWRTVTTTKKDAKEKVVTAVEKILNGEVKNPKEQTFAEYAEYYKETHAVPAKFVEGIKTEGKKSYKIIRFDIDVLITYFGKMKLKDIKRDHVLKYRQKRLETPVKKRDKDGNEYFTARAVASVNHELRTFSAMMNVAYANDLIDKPINMKGVILSSIENKLERIPTKAEFGKILDEIKKEQKRWHMTALVLLIADCGGRPIECFNLNWSDVDLINKTVIFTSDKGRKRTRRLIYMTDRLYNELLNLPRLNEYVLGGIKDVKRAWNNIKSKTGVDVDLYSLRHLYISRLDEFNLSPFLKMQLSGHSTVDMSAHYTHFSDDILKDVAEKLNENPYIN
jgi:integrase